MPDFINPYNFIPITGKNKKVTKEALKEKLSGVIEYDVLTKTPLFIPNTSNDKAFKVVFGEDATSEEKEMHKVYDFFSYHDLSAEKGTIFYNREYFEPVIPGSEIRGMLRSCYEMLTNSCMSVVDENVLLSKRTSQLFGAGLLKKTEKGYELYQAEDCLWRTKGANNTKDEEKWDSSYYDRKCYRQKDFAEGEKVYFQYTGRGRAKPLALKVSKKRSGESATEGYLIMGEDGPEMPPGGSRVSPQKHCAHIFKKKEAFVCALPDVSRLEKVIDEYQDATKPNANVQAYKGYKEELEKFKNGKPGVFFPVYYNWEKKGQDELIFLSPASKTREVYQNKLSDMLGAYRACDDRSNLCPACSVFGTLGGKGKGRFAKASKLRFTDLKVVERTDDWKGYYHDMITLTELSSPKLTNMEFYMKKPAEDAVFWTYDYYIDSRGELHILSQPQINGRKFYWHNLAPQLENAVPTKRNMTIRPLRKNVTFKGRLYFEEISRKELHSLIWLLNAGESCAHIEDAAHGYKLGAAKPLGLGSIAVHVEKVTLRSVERLKDTIAYMEKPYVYHMEELSEPDFTLFEDRTVIDRFKTMTDFHAVEPVKISYPVPDGEKDVDGFQWFARENHKAYRKKSGELVPDQSPNERRFEYYMWYMEPMNSKLVETKHPKVSAQGKRDSNNQQDYGSRGSKGRRSGKNVGDQCRGRVDHYNDKKTTAIIRLDNGGTASVYFKNIRGCTAAYGKIDQALQKDASVTVRYLGQAQGFDQWECVQFENQKE